MKKKLRFILLNGPIGSGKSTTANLLQSKLKRTAILSVEDIRQLISDFKHNREDHLLTWKIIHSMCDEYFKNGISVLLEQSYCSKDNVNQFLRLAKKHKCSIGFYHLQAPRSILLERIKQRKKDHKTSKAKIISNIKKHEETTYPDAIVIDTSEMKPVEVAKLILNDLK
ncbi:ATP-binding protein [Patescibacteria group bacterium]|nr:ATP-binding protein [Patescibacteria group bacterium]